MRVTGARLALAAAAIAVGGCGAAASVISEPDGTTVPAARAGTPGLVRNADFEAAPKPGRDCPPSWWCTMHNDPRSYRFELATAAGSSGRFLKVTRVKPEPWALVTQGVSATGLAGKRLRVSVAVNAEGLDGEAGPMILLQGPGGRVIGERKVLLKRGPGWRRASAELDVVAGTEQVEVGLLVEGGGWVGFDRVDATVLPPAGR